MSWIDDSLDNDISTLAPTQRSDSLIDQISSFERAFCSDFVCVCCSIRLSSLHELLEHVEERHAAADGTLSYPPKVEPLYSETDTSARCWALATALQPSSKRLPPLIPLGTLTTDLESSEFDDTTLIEYKSTLYHEWEPDDPSYDESHISGASALSAPSPSILPPTPLSIPSAIPSHPCPRPHDAISSSSLQSVAAQAQTELQQHSSDDMSSSPPPALFEEQRSSEVGPVRTSSTARERGRTKGGSAVISGTSKAQNDYVSSNTRRINGAITASKARSGSGSDKLTSRKKVSKKEKCHKCPTVGCTKVYLNANGLKYHQEKGTCVFEEEGEIGDDGRDRGSSTASPKPSPPYSQTEKLQIHHDSRFGTHSPAVVVQVSKQNSASGQHYTPPLVRSHVSTPSRALSLSSPVPPSPPSSSTPSSPVTPNTPQSVRNSHTALPPIFLDTLAHTDTHNYTVPEHEISEVPGILVPPFRTGPFKEVSFSSPFRVKGSCDLVDAGSDGDGKEEFVMELGIEAEPRFGEGDEEEIPFSYDEEWDRRRRMTSVSVSVSAGSVISRSVSPVSTSSMTCFTSPVSPYDARSPVSEDEDLPH